MEPSEKSTESFDRILKRLERKEAAARRRVLLWTLLPALAGALLLGSSLWAVRASSQRVTQLQEKEETLLAQLDTAEGELQRTERELSETREDLAGSREAVRFVQSGINLFHAGRYADAVRAYDSALKLDPANPYVVNLKGYSLLRADDLEGSVRALREAVEIDPDYAWGYFDLTRALCATERFDEATQAAEKALRLRPGLRAQMSQDGEFRRHCEPILDDILP